MSLQLNNVDSPFHGVTNGALHQFAIDRLGIDVRLDGKESTRITLPPLEAGRYEFYCNVPGTGGIQYRTVLVDASGNARYTLRVRVEKL